MQLYFCPERDNLRIFNRHRRILFKFVNLLTGIPVSEKAQILRYLMSTSPAFIFMPDISGFTDFVSNTELNHSQHIISELLELIIDANELDLVVSEIEGDAVLFYREGPPPTPVELESQTEKIFLAFHNYLESYRSRRICQCGACSTASRLTLKMIAHHGEIGYVTVKEFRKPHGADLILAHRLLKNEIDQDEYVLYTQALMDHWQQNGKALVQETVDCKSEYEQFGEVEYCWSDLSPLHKKVSELPPVPHHPTTDDPITAEVFINRPIDEVFEVLSNLEYRVKFSRGLEEVEFEKDRVNRVGTVHKCVVRGREAQFTTITRNDLGSDKRVFGEHLEDPPIVEDLSIYYIMEPQKEGTLLREEMHYKPGKGLSRLLLPLFKRSSRKNFKTLNADLKALIESGKIAV